MSAVISWTLGSFLGPARVLFFLVQSYWFGKKKLTHHEDRVEQHRFDGFFASWFQMVNRGFADWYLLGGTRA